MKTTPKFCRPALALLFVAMIGTASAWAQGSAGGKTILPPAPAPTIVQPPPPLPAKPVADQLAPPGWTRYEVGEPARFSLILPGQPEVNAQRMNFITDGKIIVRTYLTASESGVYGATYVEGLPAAAMNDEAAKRSFFESFVTSFVEGFQEGVQNRGVITSLKRLQQRAATAGGLMGYEQDFSYDKMLGRVRLVFAGGNAYAVLAVWNGFSSNSERGLFFESLKVNPKR